MVYAEVDEDMILDDTAGWQDWIRSAKSLWLARFSPHVGAGKIAMAQPVVKTAMPLPFYSAVD